MYCQVSPKHRRKQELCIAQETELLVNNEDEQEVNWSSMGRRVGREEGRGEGRTETKEG